LGKFTDLCFEHFSVNLLSAFSSLWSTHIYQLLGNEKGIPRWKVSVGYGLLQAIVGLSVLWVKPLGLTPVIVLLAVWFSGFFVFSSFVRRSVAHPATLKCYK
jgi:hypothetical protein